MKKTRLHLGCGTVYLDGYINIDLEGVPARLNPTLRDHNKTSRDNYFKYPFRQNILHECYDIKMDVTDLSLFDDNSVDEILTVNLAEHIRKTPFLKAVEEHWFRVLKPGGVLVVDTPHIKETAKELLTCREKPEDYPQMEEVLNWLFCHGRAQWDVHVWGYTPEYLTYILSPWFKFLKRDDKYINHDAPYPYFINFYTPKK